MDRKATIYTYSVVYVATAQFKDRVPYLMAVVEDGGNRMMARIDGFTEGMDINIGTEVELSDTDEAGNPIYRLVCHM